MLKVEPCRSLGEEWCRKQFNIATSQCRDVAGKAKQILSRKEAIKGTGRIQIGGSKNVCMARV